LETPPAAFLRQELRFHARFGFHTVGFWCNILYNETRGFTHGMELKARISKQAFEALNGFDLGEELVRPVVLQTRGQRMEKKHEVFEQLTQGQRALFSFWILQGHARDGWLMFLQECAAAGVTDAYLAIIKAGLRQLHDQAMLDHVLAAEALYREGQATLAECWETSEEDLDPAQRLAYTEIQQDFSRMDPILFKRLDESMKILETYIRANPEEFVAWEIG
jgi:hypothetical protein